jgi:hypothetical protein
MWNSCLACGAEGQEFRLDEFDVCLNTFALLASPPRWVVLINDRRSIFSIFYPHAEILIPLSITVFSEHGIDQWTVSQKYDSAAASDSEFPL